MSFVVSPVTVTAGQTITAYVGTPATVGAVVISNESPYALIASAGSGNQWILAQIADVLMCNTSAFSGSITLTASNYLTNSNEAPSYQVYLTTYAPGEAIPGTYPSALPRMLNVGNTVSVNSATNTIEQDLFTPFVLSGFIPNKDGTVANQMDVTSGIAYPKQSDGSLLRTALTASTFLTSTPSATYFLDLNPDGSWSWGTSHSTQTNYIAIATATTDGSGNIATVSNAYLGTNVTFLQGLTQSLIIPSRLDLLNGVNIGGTNAFLSGQIYLTGNNVLYQTPQTGASPVAHRFDAWDGAAQQTPFSIGGAVGNGWVDYAGVLHATGPVTLVAGVQETGDVGLQFTATAATQTYSYKVNFKTVMTNIPTSITLNAVSNTNQAAGFPTVGAITQYGFLFTIRSNAAGICNWWGTYTTVGN